MTAVAVVDGDDAMGAPTAAAAAAAPPSWACYTVLIFSRVHNHDTIFSLFSLKRGK